MQIRTITANELPQLLALYKHLYDADYPTPDPSVVAETWSRIQADPDLFYFGAFDDGQLVSSCTLRLTPSLTHGCVPYGVIEFVVTAPSHRRRGIGKAVLLHALDHAWAAKCYKVMLMTSRKTEAVFRFYRSVGFDGDARQAFVAMPSE